MQIIQQAHLHSQINNKLKQYSKIQQSNTEGVRLRIQQRRSMSFRRNVSVHHRHKLCYSMWFL